MRRTAHRALWWGLLVTFICAPLVRAAQDAPPDHFAIVQQVYATGLHDLTTEQGACRFTDAVVRALHEENPSWGHVLKERPRGGCYGGAKGHAFDAVLYRGLGRSVDIIFQQGVPGARPQWLVNDDHYAASDCNGTGCWWIPDDAHVPPAPPPVDLAPILTRLAALEAWVERAQQQLEELRAGVDILASRPLPATECRASVLRIPISCRLVP